MRVIYEQVAGVKGLLLFFLMGLLLLFLISLEDQNAYAVIGTGCRRNG
jgi:hypothetical protein